jgi:large subunit ribosomal protein L7/L12
MGKLLFLILGLALGLLLARYLRGQRAGRDLSAPPRPMVRVGDERIDNDEIRALIRADRKIEAIKLVRERTGLDLAEAKDAVEALERTMR